MRKYWTTCFWVSRLGMGAALLALFAFTSGLHASLTVVNDLSDTQTGSATGSSQHYAEQGFNTTVSGDINKITLTLKVLSGGVGDVLAVYVYTTDANGKPTSSATQLGTVQVTSLGTTQYTVNLTDTTYLLTAGHNYGIGMYLPGAEIGCR